MLQHFDAGAHVAGRGSWLAVTSRHAEQVAIARAVRKAHGHLVALGAIPRLGLVQASVRAFTGYRLAGDPLTSIMGFGDYRAMSGIDAPARVRNVVLSALVNHVNAFEVDGYADHPQRCAWIDGYQPDTPAPLPEAAGLDLTNPAHAAYL